ALVEERLGGCLIGHVSRDGTAIAARERPPLAAAPKQPEKRRGRGRPRKGEIVEKPVRRLATQPGMSLEARLADLPRACSIGNRKNAKGYKEFWRGYRLHIDVADGDIPVSCLLTGAHVHDSQAAIPLAVMTARRVTNLYDLMDSAYDVREIHDHSRSLGHVPVIDPVPRSKAAKDAWANEKKAREQIAWKPAEARRLAQRTSCERVNSRLKDQFGGNHVRVRGPTKAMCHLMFGILALTVDQLIRLVT
ncbi:MAG TPA: transposase, partial [Geminicoccaceae bacterium]|nr:transposase [Geminicoccaceae bacterium]